MGVKITGMEDFMRKLDRLAENAKALGGEHSVPMPSCSRLRFWPYISRGGSVRSRSGFALAASTLAATMRLRAARARARDLHDGLRQNGRDEARRRAEWAKATLSNDVPVGTMMQRALHGERCSWLEPEAGLGRFRGVHGA
jgi:hypothetical protein